jgi:[ribosomal protein S5]-alanine N-acetyltransferase
VEYPDVHPVTLNGERIVLREIELTDTDAAYRWASDDAFFRYLPFETVKSRSAEEEFLRAVQRDALSRPRHEYHLGIMSSTSNDLVGMARLGIKSPQHREADMGYGLRPDRWGEGIATEAAALLLDFGFGQLKLHRILACHHPENIASGRVLQKVGMLREDTLRENIFAHGARRDSVLYSMVDREWLQRSQS